MPLKLIPPGRRKGYRFWYAVGTVAGQRVERSLETLDAETAKQRKAKLEAAIWDAAEQDGQPMTFAMAAERYIQWRKPSLTDSNFIGKLVSLIGNDFVSEINQARADTAAKVLYPDCKPATHNRLVVTPISAILNFAAKNNWRPPIKFERYKTPRAQTRYVSDAHEQWLLMATEGDPQKQLLILWLFRQGDRIGDVLKIRHEDCDLKNKLVRRHISKTDTYKTLPLDDDIVAMLKKTGETHGKIFHWQHRHGVNKWLRNLARKLEIRFTPHMARHTVGKRLSDSGASLRTIMAKLGHADYSSSLRYQAEDIDTIRKASSAAIKREKLRGE